MADTSEGIFFKGEDRIQRIFSNRHFHFILLLFVILIAYKDLFSVYFLSDDFDLILGKLNWLDPSAGFFRPVPHLLLVLLYKIFGLNALPFQIMSLSIHFLNAILIYLIIEKLIGNRYFSMAASVLFSVSFLITEAVFWISGVTSLLVTMFYLLSINLYLNFRKSKNGVFYVLMLMSFAGALLSKENAVTLPFILFMIELFCDKKKILLKHLWKSFIKLAPVFFIMAVFLILKLDSLSDATGKNISIGYHNIRNFRFLILSLFTFNMFYDVPVLFIDAKIINIFSEDSGINLMFSGSEFKFVLLY